LQIPAIKEKRRAKRFLRSVNDIDFEHKLINVAHQLLKVSEVGYHVEAPKIKSGIRQIPMSTQVYEAFKRVLT